MSNERGRPDDPERRPDQHIESRNTLTNVEGGDPGVTRDTVEEARQTSRGEAPGVPARPPEIDPNDVERPLRGDRMQPETKNAQDLSGGAKEAFETARDNREGFQEIDRGFELEGRERREGLGNDAVDQEISDLPADARMNQEARGRANEAEGETTAPTLDVGPNVPIDGGEVGERSGDVMPDVPSKGEEDAA